MIDDREFARGFQHVSADRATRSAVLVMGGLGAAVGLAASAAAIAPTQVPHRPEDLILAVSWWAGVIIAVWWSASVIYWLVRFGTSPFHSATTAVRLDICRFTLPGSRRIAEGLFAFGLVAVPACSPDVDPPTMVLIGDAAANTTSSTPTTSIPTTTTTRSTSSTTTPKSTSTAPPTVLNSPPPTTPPPAANPPAADEPTLDDAASPIEPEIEQHSAIEAHVVLVNPGDNLWQLSAEAIEQQLGREPSVPQITRYWRLVVSANHVRSGNANLIVPGEPISMPSFALDRETSNSETTSLEPLDAG